MSLDRKTPFGTNRSSSVQEPVQHPKRIGARG